MSAARPVLKRSTALLALGAVVAAPNAVRAQSAIPLRIASPPGTSETPALYAAKAGIFKAHGLDADIQKLNSGAAIVAAVVGGSMDIGTGNAFSVVTAFAHKVPVRIVAGGAIYNADEPIPYGMLLVKKDGPIHSVADLAGKTVGLAVARGDLNAVATQAYVEQHGGTWSDIHVLEIPQDAMVAALGQGRIDAFTMQSPGGTIAMASGQVRLLGKPYDAIARRFTIATWFAQADWASRNADTVRRFDQAMAEASRYCNEHPQDVLPLLASFTGIAPNVIANAARAPFVDHVEPSDLQPIIDAEVKYKVIDAGFAAHDLIAPAAFQGSAG